VNPAKTRGAEVRCYLCNGTGFSERKGTVRDDPSLRILECDGCGLVTLSSLSHIKPGHYEDSGMHGEELRSIESWLRESDGDDQRRFEMLKPAMADRRVLDFGCGAGGFLFKARAVASLVTGVEAERRVRDHWQGQVPLYGRLDELNGKTYDLVTAFHVVEHLSDPRSMLRDLGKHLGESGRMVIEVPNSDDALLTLYQSEAFQRFTYWSQHLFLFNAETLRRVAVEAGLRVVAVQQFQRYPLSNHLHWLSGGRSGGHRNWGFLDSDALHAAYSASLASVGKCDTLIAHLERGVVDVPGKKEYSRR